MNTQSLLLFVLSAVILPLVIHAKPEGAQRDGGNARQPPSIEQVFARLDADASGSISVDETKQLLSDITGHKSISREECEQFVKSLDEQDKMKDHESDNKIEKEEFIFFVDDMMAMEADQRKEYAAKGAFYQTLILRSYWL